MKLTNLKRASDWEVREWLKNSIPELTVYQKEKIRDEIIQFAPFYFYKKRKKVNNVFVRLSVIFIPPVWIILAISLPFNFIVTGKWGYNKLEWYSKWISACGL